MSRILEFKRKWNREYKWNKYFRYFETDSYKKWNKNIPINNKKCQNCNSIFICGGGCAMQSKTLFGDEAKIDKAFCIHSKLLLKFLLTELYIEENIK